MILRLDSKLLALALCLLKTAYTKPLGLQPGLQVPLEDLTGDSERKVQASRQLHGRFLHITGRGNHMHFISTCKTDSPQTFTLILTTNCMPPPTKKALAIEGREWQASMERRPPIAIRRLLC